MTTAECKRLRNAILASMAKKALTGDTKAAQILLDHLDTVAPREANNQVLDNFLEALDLPLRGWTGTYQTRRRT